MCNLPNNLSFIGVKPFINQKLKDNMRILAKIDENMYQMYVYEISLATKKRSARKEFYR
jgi:hypothetical protein